MIKYTITPQNVIPANLHLIDSYTVPKKDYEKTLNQIKALHPKSEVWARGFPQMKLEWAVHNFLHQLGLWKARTKDCDMDYPQSFFVRAAYAVFGVLVWPFVK